MTEQQPDTPTGVTLRVLRFDPERDDGPRWESYRVPVPPGGRVLDALQHVKDHLDASLTFRRNCGQGTCGSDAVRVDGVNRLACTTLVEDLLDPDAPGSELRVEPLLGLPVLRDLVVDTGPFFASYRAVSPWLLPAGPDPAAERAQTPVERDRIEQSSRCILCLACTTACPVSRLDGPGEGGWPGPAAIVNAHRFVFDSRDAATARRLEVLDGGDGVWRCRTVFTCTDACPRGIPVTEAIAEVKRALLFGTGAG